MLSECPTALDLGSRNVLQLGCEVGAVEADGGAEELVRLHLSGAPRQVVGQESGRCGSVRVDAVAEPPAGDLGDVRVVIVRTVNAVAVDLVIEVRVGVGMCRRGQADRNGNGGDRGKPRYIHGLDATAHPLAAIPSGATNSTAPPAHRIASLPGFRVSQLPITVAKVTHKLIS